MSTTIQYGAADGTRKAVAAAPQMPVIELQGLSVRFGSREILKGVDLFTARPCDRFAWSQRCG